ncbi:protein hid1 [Holotrichia oblita]|uniref:Protein hid1 n=1 Tax=Holotrichia oblita TaxID=644536 RepID=A0ACB9SR80_HOLOL|nr:protein hid1 [Holotrichia oblita]
MERFFWSSLPSQNEDEDESLPLAQSLLNATCDLLFCPDFTVMGTRKIGPDKAEDLSAIDSCEYIWEAGVGFAQTPPRHPQVDTNRTELLKLLLTCFSETMYQPPMDISQNPNKWIAYLTSAENRHALPMFTSLLNTVCAYDPVGLGVPYNHLIFNDSVEPLVEACLQILIVTLDHDTSTGTPTETEDTVTPDNLFINYLSRIHRDEDFNFILQGITRLLNNPLVQTYLPNSTKKVHFHQELLVFFWKMCDYNKYLKSFFYYTILARVGLMHIGVFILLLLSGERNFGVRLNKPYTATIPMDIPVFTGTHADLLIIVFHKIITTGHQRLQPLFDCLLTILVNGNSNLVYTIIRKRQVFHSLANLPCDYGSITKSLNKRSKRHLSTSTSHENVPETAMEGSRPALPAEPGTLKATLPDTPAIAQMTERESAHPSYHQLEQLSTLTNGVTSISLNTPKMVPSSGDGDKVKSEPIPIEVKLPKAESQVLGKTTVATRNSLRVTNNSDPTNGQWVPTAEWVHSWKSKLPLQTIMRLLQVLVPQVEKICIDKGLTDESEILKFLQHGTLVGLLPVPHPILIRKYQANSGMYGGKNIVKYARHFFPTVYLVLHLCSILKLSKHFRNVDPPVWYDTDVKLFEIQRV